MVNQDYIVNPNCEEYFDGEPAKALVIKRRVDGYTLAHVRDNDLYIKDTGYATDDEWQDIKDYVNSIIQYRKDQEFYGKKTREDAAREGKDFDLFLSTPESVPLKNAWENAVYKKSRALTDEELIASDDD